MKSKKMTSILLACCIALLLCMFSTCSFAESANISKDGATVFTFSDTEIAVANGNKDNYTVKGTALTIKGSGTYVLTGQCNAGSINVKKGTKDVNLVLSGLTLTASDATAALVCSKSTSVTIYADEETENTLADTKNNNDEITDSVSGEALFPDAENAVIKCKDGSQVTFSGTGTLNVNANGKNAIKSGATTEDEGEAFLTVKNLTLNITATATANANDGINAEQLLNIESGSITVSANDDGIHSDLIMNIGAKNTVGPQITVLQSEEGIEASALNIYSGNIAVTANDDGINAANADLDEYDFQINIEGGKVYVNAITGDGIDSNGKLSINGGTVEVYASARGDNAPLDSDGTFLISGGTVFAVGNSQMAQTPVSGSQLCTIFGSNNRLGGMFGVNTKSAISIEKDDVLTVCKKDGTVLYEGKAQRSANYVVFSSEALTENEEYVLKVNGETVSSVNATAPNGSTFTPGGPGNQGGQQGGGFSVFEKIIEFFNRIIAFFKSVFGMTA